MVQPTIKNGTRYNLRQETSEERDAASFDKEYMEASSSSSDETTSSAGSTTPASTIPTKVLVANREAHHMRILAEAVQKLKQRNEKLIQEKEELKRENIELRSKISSDAGNVEESEATASKDNELVNEAGSSEDELTSAESEAIDELSKHSSQDGVSTFQSGVSSEQSLDSGSSESDFLAVSASASTLNSERAKKLSDLHKTLDENNVIISDLSSRVSELKEMDRQNQRAIGLLHAKLVEQEDSKQVMTGAKQDVLDQLESKRVGVIELEKKLKEAIEDHGEEIRKSKDLEISLADRAFLSAELRRELNASEEEVARMTEEREQDVQEMVKHRMVQVERRMFRDAEASMREVQRNEMDVMAAELLAVEEKAKTMRQKLSDRTFEQQYDHGSTDTITSTRQGESMRIVESKSSSSDSSEEMIDPWFSEYREENRNQVLKTSLSREVPPTTPPTTEVVHNLNELKSVLAFSEKINKMTVSAIKEKVLLANTKVEKMRKVFDIVPFQLKGSSSQVTGSTSLASDVVEFTSLSQEWEAYYDEKKQAQEAVKTTFEKEAMHFAQAIRKNTFLFGGFLDNDDEE